MTTEQLIKAAVITGAHGLKGAVRVHILHADAFASGAFTDASGNPLALKIIRDDGPGNVIAILSLAADRLAAERLKGTAIYAPQSALPKLKADEFYSSQLLGLSVMAAGSVFGIVSSVENYGAGDLLEIELAEGKKELYPFTKAFFGDIDWTRKQIAINLPESEE